MTVDIVDKYCTDNNNPIKNLRLNIKKKKKKKKPQLGIVTRRYSPRADSPPVTVVDTLSRY
jgi:hypothetical protein